MYKKIVCKSYLNEQIVFTYAFPFFLVSDDGFHEVSGTVSGMKSAFAIGENYIDTSINKRVITLVVAIKDNKINNRQKLYRLFPLRKKGTLYYYEEDIARKIDYVVEDIKPIKSKIYEQYQITLICHNPYFTDIEKNVYQMATWKPCFKFKMSIPISTGIKFGTKNTTSMTTIVNSSNIEFGMTITFTANDVVTNPSLFNVDTREELKIEKVMQPGDKIVVTTYRQNKNIIYISSSTGVQENINNLFVYGSKFLQIHTGSNTADENVDSLEAVIEYYAEYEAV